jgi:sporulation protein YlmC with PRC-barrel domain
MSKEKNLSEQMFKVSELLEKDVKNLQDEILGKVEELMVVQNIGKIPYAVLSSGDKLFILPWKALTLSHNNDEIFVTLDIDKKKFEEGPSFDINKWEEVSKQWWEPEIYHYYGYEPHWLDEIPPNLRGWEPSSEYHKKCLSGEVETISGEVIGVEKITPMKGMAEGIFLRLRSDGKVYLVSLGPSWYFDRMGNRFWEAHTVSLITLEIKAVQTTIEGETLYIATEVNRGGKPIIILIDGEGLPIWNALPQHLVLDIKKTSDFLEKPVEDLEGRNLGKIEELVVDADAERVAYAVLSFGGILSIGEHFSPIPWNALRFSYNEAIFIIDLDKEELKNAPNFDKDNWQDMTNFKWLDEVYKYYGCEPYWINN